MYHLLLTFSAFILLRTSRSPVCYAFWQPFKSKGFEWEQNKSICPNFITLSTLLHHIVEKPLPRNEETTFLVWALAVTNQLGCKQQCGFWKALSFLLCPGQTRKPLSCHRLLSCLSHVPLSPAPAEIASQPVCGLHPHPLQSIPYPQLSECVYRGESRHVTLCLHSPCSPACLFSGWSPVCLPHTWSFVTS